MTRKNKLINSLDEILIQYKDSFSSKIYNEENDEHDLLMNLFRISPELKRENRQYWGRNSVCVGKGWSLRYVGRQEKILPPHLRLVLMNLV